jgi:uncharacterized DUF497 family protein
VTATVRGDFEWDSTKAASNVEKHGVSFEQAIVALSDPSAIETADHDHADRVVTFGFEPTTGVLLVVSTEIGARTRIIHARLATPAQRRRYHEG